MFIWIDNGKNITAINKKFIRFSLDYTDDFRLILKNDIDTENDYQSNNIFGIFINILDDFLDLISSN